MLVSKLRMADRRTLLVRAAVLAAVTASLGLFAAGNEPPQAPLASAAPTRILPTTHEAPERAELFEQLLERRALAPATGDLFASRSWQPPAPAPAPKVEVAAPPPPPPEPPAPVAPPLPFSFLGAFEPAGGKRMFYLAEADKVHVVSAGDTIGTLYRIEAPNTEGLVLLYLPLEQRQTLAFEGRK
jgi:hypothetical protein